MLRNVLGSKSHDLKHALLPQHVVFLKSTSKQEALTELLRTICTSPQINDADAFAKGIFHREQLLSTGIGLGIGVPHVRLPSVTGPVVAAGRCEHPLADYESLDGEPVELIFMIGAREDQHQQHLRLLAEISRIVKEPSFRRGLETCRSPESFYTALMG